MICPEHKSLVHQELHCDDAEHEVDRNATLRGQITEEGIRIIDPEEIPQFDASETFDLVAVSADDLETYTSPDRSVYYVLPKPKSGSDTVWHVFYDLVGNKKVAYVVNGSLRKGRRSIYRLTHFNGYLALRQLKFPADVREAPEMPEATETKKVLTEFKKIAKEFSDSAMVNWEQFDSEDEYKDRINEFLSRGELVDAPAKAKKDGSESSGNSTEDMMAALKDAIKGG
jgi:non-homologous end joining protein Ku